MTARTHILALDPGERFQLSPGGWVLQIEGVGDGPRWVRGPKGDRASLRDFLLIHHGAIFVYPLDPDRPRGKANHDAIS